MKEQIVFGTRGSPLAIFQTNNVIAKLNVLFPHIIYKSRIIQTKGDRDQHTSLTLTEELGLFSNEIQSELLRRNIDAAVHSLKDIPVEYSEDLCLVAIPERVEAKDILYHPLGLSINELSAGSVVGTCSLRRKGQLLNLRKDLLIKDIRGNIQTRIEKLHSGEYDAIILAAAGLMRLGFEISKYYMFDFDEITPAPGQGALAVETRMGDIELIKMITCIDDLVIRKAVEVERSILKYIGTGCSAPIGVFASSTDEGLDVIACYVNPITGDKKVVRQKKLKGLSSNIAEVVAYKLLSAIEGNIANSCGV